MEGKWNKTINVILKWSWKKVCVLRKERNEKVQYEICQIRASHVKSVTPVIGIDWTSIIVIDLASRWTLDPKKAPIWVWVHVFICAELLKTNASIMMDVKRTSAWHHVCCWCHLRTRMASSPTMARRNRALIGNSHVCAWMWHPTTNCRGKKKKPGSRASLLRGF